MTVVVIQEYLLPQLEQYKTMKVTVDTDLKTVTLHEDITIKEFLEYFTDHKWWAEYKILTSTQVVYENCTWINPQPLQWFTVYPQPYYIQQYYQPYFGYTNGLQSVTLTTSSN